MNRLVPSTIADSVALRNKALKPEVPFAAHFRENGCLPDEELLDIAGARRWFEILERAYQNDYYTLQQTLDGKSGARITSCGNRYLIASSYDYLGLIGHPRVEAAAVDAIREYGTSTGGVRLLTGTTRLHRKFESELAAFKGVESSITFTSGYMANLAIISSLFGPNDCVIVDSRTHRSVIDACRLARVKLQRFRHNDITSLKLALVKKPSECRTLVVVDGIYSMDGDICPLNDIVHIKNSYGAFLMVDEAHSFGVLGSTGRGIDEHFGVKATEIDIWTGSLSKAIPANGGYVAGTHQLIIYLQHAASQFVFSSALSPASVAAAGESLRILQSEPERLARLHRNADYLRNNLNELDYDTGESVSPVIPIIVGDEERAFRASRELFGMGIIATAIAMPAVPHGAARLRICATATQDDGYLGELIEGFRKLRHVVYD